MASAPAMASNAAGGERTAVSQAARAPRAARLRGLPPLVCADTRLLVLGSFPGAASLAARQYYAHPRNQFWPILSAFKDWATTEIYTVSYEKRSKWVLAHGLGVWDVYGACEREGSLDSRIRDPELNDFGALQARCPRLAAMAHNGAESFRHAGVGKALGLPVYRLPSTSPANASWRFEAKLAAWREVFARHGLV